MVNYAVVLFKNKKRKRIIKKFVTLKKAKGFYDNLIKESDNVIFNVAVENGEVCNFELGLIQMSSNHPVPVYKTDDFGRNIKVVLEDSGMTLTNIKSYRKEELIYDIQKKEKINTDILIKRYLKGDGLKMISILNNKIIIQQDDIVNLFSLKTEEESSRFIDCLSLYFFKMKRADCLFIKDYSSAQRKYLFSLLESKGIDKKILYRKFTTFPRSK